MSDPAWMQPPQLKSDHGPLLNNVQSAAHLSWPWNTAASYNIPSELDGILQQRQGTGCQIVKYLFKGNKWRFNRATKSLDGIKDMVSRIDLPLHQDNAAGAFL